MTTYASRTTPGSRDLRRFLVTALCHPVTVGAIAPSSPRLARQLAAVVPEAPGAVVVELGPGTGSVSDAIGRRLSPGARHVAVEVDPKLADHVRATRPRVEVLTGDASRLLTLLDRAGVHRADAVVSGLPWSLFPAERQRDIIGQVARLVGADGAFAAFAYLHARQTPPARRFRALLGETFNEVIVGRTVWRNLPPAYLYVCRRPDVEPRGRRLVGQVPV
jgi:phosphatidylethanolamine/phosphatidyl-N-methylethanolamine N-methyltransferase